jgi:hypothetical protein
MEHAVGSKGNGAGYQNSLKKAKARLAADEHG